MSSPQESMPSIVAYLNIYLSVGYYLLIFPFKIKPQERITSDDLDTRSGFRFHSPTTQKLLCGLAYFSVLYHQIFILTHPKFIGTFPKEGLLSFLGIIYRFVGLAFLFCARTVFWKKKEDIMHIFKSIQKLPYGTPPKTKTAMILINMGFLITYCWYLYGLFGELFTCFDDEFELKLSSNFTSALNCLHSKGEMIFLFNTSPQVVSFQSIRLGEGLIALTYFTLYVYTGFLQIAVEMLVLVGIVFIWHTARLFEKWYKKLDCTDDSKSQLVLKALEEYQLLKSLIRRTNKILGPPIVLVIAFCLPFYATFAGMALSSKATLGGHPMAIMILHYTIYFTEIIMAAEVNRKGNDFVRWVSSPKFIHCLSNQQLTSLSMDMSSNQLALKGCGLFSLTYKFLTSILGVFITYSILVVQFRSIPIESPTLNVQT